MGLKQDLIDAKIEGLKESGVAEDAIQQAEKSLDIQCELEKEAIVNFLTKCQFRVTQLNANVILEDFKIPPQQGDIQPDVQVAANIPVNTSGGPGTTTAVGMLNNTDAKENGTGGILTKDIDVGVSGGKTGVLQSTGYTYIGGDPFSQDNFDVEDESGQRIFTEVKLFRDDIEDLL